MISQEPHNADGELGVADFSVDLTAYAGPLDLLLYLARKEELDLTTISLSKVLKQFLEFVDVLKEIDIDGVGEL